MRVAASYNFFNGDEHLLSSLKTMRLCVDHISVVWQDISNAGEAITATAKSTLQTAANSGLVDLVIYYSPNLSLERSENERRKRRLGLEAAMQVHASHFLSMDADEFYRPSEFDNAKKVIKSNNWPSTSVESFLHIKRPIWRSKDSTCCCFLTAIENKTDIGVDSFPCENVDPTRRMTANAQTHHHFSTREIAMYHMNLVRVDLSQKLRNSSTRDDEFLSSVERAVKAWEPGPFFEFPRKGLLNVRKVENEFNTYDPENFQTDLN